MSLKEKPIIKLYEYKTGTFSLIAMIDDYMEASWEDNLYQAGRFTITINFNIPNASLFERKLFIQFGNSSKFGEITIIQDSIGEDGKGSQLRVISGYDARYILKRRVIKNMNSNGLWQMTDKGELCIRNLIKDQCGSSAEVKRRLPIINTIPASQDAIGKEYTVSESFTNLYEVCKTIATQSEIGWRIDFDGEDLTLICFPGTDRSDNVRFDTNFESLRDGQFSDSSESYSNTIYVGGKGQNDNRDIYEGEDLIDGESPASLDRFESWDNQSSLTTEEEYEAEALSMLNQYGQTITMSGNGLAKCPYEYEKEYFVGDMIVLAFSGKSAKVQILSVTEHWTWASYEIQFQFGKPINNLSDQLQLMLRQIQKASNKQSAVDSVRWYELPDEDEMPKADVTYDTLGFTGAVPNNGTFKLYLDDEKTGSKYYDIYVKNLTGNKLTLTTEKTIEGQPAQDLVLNIGTYVANIYVDENGNIILNSSTPAQTVEEGNNQPVTSDAVYQAIQGGGGSGGVPIGSIIAMHSSNPPNSNWLLCDGSTFDENEYPALYMYLGSNVLPDLRECTIVGAGHNSTNIFDNTETDPSTQQAGTQNHDVYTLGEFKDDQLQDHTHTYKLAVGQSRGGSGSVVGYTQNSNTGNVTVGSARVGTTTHGKQVGENWFIKAVTSTPDSDFQGTVQTIKDYVDNSNSYSTEETATGGFWIDNKPIYRKCYVLDITSGTSATIQADIKATLGIDFVTKLYGIFNNSAGSVGLNYYYSSSDFFRVLIDTQGKLLWQRGNSTPSLPLKLFVIIEYTKS